MPDRLARERIGTMLFYGTVLLVAYLAYRLFEPFLAPLTWAAILGALFYPWQRRLQARMGKTWAAAVNTFMVTAVIIVPALLLMTAFVRETTQAVRAVEDTLAAGGLPRLQRGYEWLQTRMFGLETPSLEDLIRQGTGWAAGFVASHAGAVVRNVAGLFIDLIVMLFAVFFFFRDGGAIMAGARRLLPFEVRQRERMIDEAGDLVRASIQAGLIVSAVQGFIGGLAFAVLGLGAPVFWGVVMAFFALLPIFGAWVVWAPAAGWLLLDGSVARGVTLIAIGAGIVGLVDNFLRPALLSGRTQMHGLLVFVGLLGGVAAFGLLGLVLGPVVLAMAISLLRAYTVADTAAAAGGGPSQH